MKKNSFYLWGIMMVIALCVGFTSCGDDEEDSNGGEPIEGPISANALVGTWKYVGTLYVDDGEYENSSDRITYFHYNADGTGAKYWHSNRDYDWDMETFKYVLDQRNIIITYDHLSDSNTYEIVSLTNMELILGMPYHKYQKVDDSILPEITDEDDEDNYQSIPPEQLVQEKYRQAFFSIFGKIAPNQDWGFNENTHYLADNNHASDESEFTFLCRIFAEDLSASSGSDFDFNDVVFDVYTNSQNQAKVVIKAVGSTLPLTIAGYEVHDLYGVPVSTMVNTNSGVNMDDVELPILIDNISTAADVNTKIVVKVTIRDTECELEAQRGEPASKLAVSEKVEWCTEREDISSKYPNFSGWVGGYIDCWWK